jgi:hypothetical protein
VVGFIIASPFFAVSIFCATLIENIEKNEKYSKISGKTETLSIGTVDGSTSQL